MDSHDTTRKSYIWFAIASMLNSAMSVIMMFAVTRVLGVAEGGIFSFAFSTAQLLLTIGYFEMRPFQVTDVNNSYGFGVYCSSRCITCIMMGAACVGYTMMKSYSGDKLVIFVLLCLLKMTDAIEDVFHGQLQKMNHLDIAGIFQVARLSIVMIVFFLHLFLCRNMISSLIVVVIISFVLAIIPNLIVCSKYSITLSFSGIRDALSLLKDCLPLCLSAFLSLFLVNIPRFAIDSCLGDSEQGIYNILFFPSYFINLLSGFVFRPSLTSLANDWNNRLLSNVKKKYIKMSQIILLITAVSIVLGAIWGTTILGYVYDVDVSQYRSVLIITLIGGCFYALGVLIYYGIAISRKQQVMILIYVVVAGICYALSKGFVEHMGIMGASLIYIIGSIMRFGGFLVVFLIICKRYGHEI